MMDGDLTITNWNDENQEANETTIRQAPQEIQQKTPTSTGQSRPSQQQLQKHGNKEPAPTKNTTTSAGRPNQTEGAIEEQNGNHWGQNDTNTNETGTKKPTSATGGGTRPATEQLAHQLIQE